MKITSTFDKIGRAITISGLVATTPREDFEEMRRMWNATSKSNRKPYTKKSVLLASGGEKK